MGLWRRRPGRAGGGFIDRLRRPPNRRRSRGQLPRPKMGFVVGAADHRPACHYPRENRNRCSLRRRATPCRKREIVFSENCPDDAILISLLAVREWLASRLRGDTGNVLIGAVAAMPESSPPASPQTPRANKVSKWYSAPPKSMADLVFCGYPKSEVVEWDSSSPASPQAPRAEKGGE